MKKLQVFQNCWSLWTIPGPNPACNVIRPTRKSGEVQQGRVKKIYLMILRDLWWVSITPTLCKLLAHTGDIIEANDGYSLKKFSDEGPEAINKRVRQIRTNLARKRSQHTVQSHWCTQQAVDCKWSHDFISEGKCKNQMLQVQKAWTQQAKLSTRRQGQHRWGD